MFLEFFFSCQDITEYVPRSWLFSPPRNSGAMGDGFSAEACINEDQTLLDCPVSCTPTPAVNSGLTLPLLNSLAPPPPVRDLGLLWSCSCRFRVCAVTPEHAYSILSDWSRCSSNVRAPIYLRTAIYCTYIGFT